MSDVRHQNLGVLRLRHALGAVAVVMAGLTIEAGSSHAQSASPEIRTSAANPMPACVTPERLMAYLEERNPSLDPRFKDIARIFKQQGEALRIRWDYAFFQMLLETNSLKYGGDVKARQNNFAGIGATGGGVKGDVFPDVSTGVLAQMQHLIAYSGEKVERPVATRTRENQDHIIAKSARLGRPVTFADLTRRWAVDSKYIRSIETLADKFRERHCNGIAAPANQEARAEPTKKRLSRKGSNRRVTEAAPDEAPAVQEPVVSGAELARKAIAESKAEGPVLRTGLGVPALTLPAVSANCKIWSASYGGTAAALIRADKGGATHLTVLRVAAGSEAAQSEHFIADHAAGGTVVGIFASPDEAMTRAFVVCPEQ